MSAVLTCTLVCCGAGVMTGCGTGVHASRTQARIPAYPHPGTYQVIAIYDGQTIAVDHHGKELVVRLLGVSAGNLLQPNGNLGRDFRAMRYLRDVLGGRRVRLAFDPDRGTAAKATRANAYASRVSAYVYVIEPNPTGAPRERHINPEMLRLGYAIPDGSEHEFASYFYQQYELGRQRRWNRNDVLQPRPLYADDPSAYPQQLP